MKKVSRKPADKWLKKQKKTYDRAQPTVGTKLELSNIIFRVNHTPKQTFWQRVRGWL